MPKNPIKIATWNVNSVNARLPNVVEYLRENPLDIVLLQELKCVEEAFPALEIGDLGYNVAVFGQKTYNGVAILSKFPIDEVIRGIPEFQDDQSRYIEAVISVPNGAIRVASVYVPNGGEVESDKFQYKMRFFDALNTHLKNTLKYEEVFLVGGDYNVAFEDIDVHNPAELRGTTCFHPKEQQKFASILNLGFDDSFRKKNPDLKEFSWWDYRAGGWQNNKGMRIDYILTSPEASDKITNCWVDKTPRGKEKASDHTVVVCELAID
jgi:exodeoxyribonuclease-3